jgi:predicted dinucleotide-binding enzyme
MKMGILSVGHIGKTLARKLAAAGHHVKVANSRGPETIETVGSWPAPASSEPVVESPSAPQRSLASMARRKR